MQAASSFAVTTTLPFIEIESPGTSNYNGEGDTTCQYLVTMRRSTAATGEVSTSVHIARLVADEPQGRQGEFR